MCEATAWFGRLASGGLASVTWGGLPPHVVLVMPGGRQERGERARGTSYSLSTTERGGGGKYEKGGGGLEGVSIG